jgi:membrane-bound lytic murein transglycosylase MltF
VGNKLTYILAFAGLVALAQRAEAPIRLEHYFQPLKEKVIISENPLEKTAKENERKLHNLIEEINWMENDEVYRKVTRAYTSLKVPEYITRKFIRCLGYVESSDDPKNISPVGARGWGQLMREAWYEVEDINYEENVFNLEKNIEATIKYTIFLSNSLRILNSNWENLSPEEKASLMADAYNGGIGNLTKANFDVNNMKIQTKAYVPRIKEVAEQIAPKVDLFQ